MLVAAQGSGPVGGQLGREIKSSLLGHCLDDEDIFSSDRLLDLYPRFYRDKRRQSVTAIVFFFLKKSRLQINCCVKRSVQN